MERAGLRRFYRLGARFAGHLTILEEQFQSLRLRGPCPAIHTHQLGSGIEGYITDRADGLKEGPHPDIHRCLRRSFR